MKWRALPAFTLLLLAAPLTQRAVPTDVIRVEDPEPLPDAPKTRTVPPTAPDPASPSGQRPPETPESRIVQPPVLVLPPERPAPPGKAPAITPK